MPPYFLISASSQPTYSYASRPRFMKRFFHQLLITTLAFCWWVPLRAQDGSITADTKREAKLFPHELEDGARAVFARLKDVSVPNSRHVFIPFAFGRRIEPQKYGGQWVEHSVVMPGRRAEPDLHNRVLRDFQQQLPGQLTGKIIDAYLVIYEDSGAVHLIVHSPDGSESRFRAARPENLHELKLGDFRSE